MIIVTQTMALLLCYISNSYGTRVNQYCESNVVRENKRWSGKSQGILWGAIAGHPDKILVWIQTICVIHNWVLYNDKLPISLQINTHRDLSMWPHHMGRHWFKSWWRHQMSFDEHQVIARRRSTYHSWSSLIFTKAQFCWKCPNIHN